MSTATYTPATHVLYIPEGHDQSFAVLDDVDEDGHGYMTTVEGPAIVRLVMERGEFSDWLTCDDREYGAIGVPLESVEDGVSVTVLPVSVATPAAPFIPFSGDEGPW